MDEKTLNMLERLVIAITNQNIILQSISKDITGMSSDIEDINVYMSCMEEIMEKSI